MPSVTKLTHAKNRSQGKNWDSSWPIHSFCANLIKKHRPGPEFFVFFVWKNSPSNTTQSEVFFLDSQSGKERCNIRQPQTSSCFQRINMGVSKNRGTQKWMVYNVKPYWNGWFGGITIFGNTHITWLLPKHWFTVHVMKVKKGIPSSKRTGYLPTLTEFLPCPEVLH